MNVHHRIKYRINQYFYKYKYLIPRNAQLFIRRQIVGWQRRHHSKVWPIDERAGKAPEGWTGWPHNKRFAFALMHDVDTQRGHDNCLNLVEREKKLGIKSCYFFVPERYRVSKSILFEVNNQGFDIGVHGLNHDGTLFSSWENFCVQSKKINNYIKEWGVSGFSSPSMHHNLGWTHKLAIDYDISTFDTDPFEPQPDGMTTIFPFIVKDSRNNHLYIELPYTLPQDSTLYILMRHTSIDIWKKKIDWIAEHGGMALFNSHPDYMNFNGTLCDQEQYPVGYFEEFIDYVFSRYADQFWQPTPGQLAAFWRSSGVRSTERDIPLVID